MSLLSQLRPASSEKANRRWGKRTYDPNYNLCRHVTYPTAEEGRDPKPPPFRLDTKMAPTEHVGVYTTPHGVLAGEVMDQFALHSQWKTASQMAYVLHNPPYSTPIKPTKPCYMPRADMTLTSYSGMGDPNGPYEYQQCVASRGLLPENKVWQSVEEDYRRFPHNTYSRKEPMQIVRRGLGYRSEEETEEVMNYIRDLVKKNQLNPQYIRPKIPYQGIQDQVRIHEPLKRPPGRNPPNATSTYQANFCRSIPSKEYRQPKFGTTGEMSKTVVHQRPFNSFNNVEPPTSLDYLPMPWTFTRKPTDLRLISGYRL